jgi:predicted nucleic acid-binding Zn ribbon protein
MPGEYETSVSRSAELAAYATPESADRSRSGPAAWRRKSRPLREAGQLDLDQLAARLKVSQESALYFLSCACGSSGGRRAGPAAENGRLQYVAMPGPTEEATAAGGCSC